MKKWFIISLLAIMLPVVVRGQYGNSDISRLNVSVGVSTLGAGFELLTPLSRAFKVRAGVDYVKFNTGYFDVHLNDNTGILRESIGYVPDYRMKGIPELIHGHLLFDFRPVKTGLFYVTAGTYLGSTKITADGYFASNEDKNKVAELRPGFSWPTADFEGFSVNVQNGRAAFEAKLDNAVKPYLGMGLGRELRKKSAGFRCELGVLYQGDYSIIQDGKKVHFENGEANDLNKIDDILRWSKWWPMLKLCITYGL